jgi:hypothetical protein
MKVRANIRSSNGRVTSSFSNECPGWVNRTGLIPCQPVPVCPVDGHHLTGSAGHLFRLSEIVFRKTDLAGRLSAEARLRAKADATKQSSFLFRCAKAGLLRLRSQ